uniref:Gypsy retrotransposon integrase-like protein 1 n=1 Tax=Acanthochromis polyacanthus TaxID=80966 RepID=A0A3Q1HDU2_9TELE
MQTYDPMGLKSSLNPDSILPQGLIGPRCAAAVLVDGTHCESIMDSGSQVTTISESFHKKHLSHLPIQPVHALLEIEGAGGQNVPYLGYIQTNITFPKNVTGTEQELVVLVLVVPECHFNSQIPLLVGTNALLRLYGKLLEQDGPKFIHKLHSKQFAMILQHVAQTQRNDTHSCNVMLHSKRPVTIPAKHKICITGNVRLRKNNQNTSFVLEPHEQYKLPGGLLLESALVDIPFNANNKVPVIVHNVSEHSVTLQPNSIVAQACAAQHVSPMSTGQTQNPVSQHNPDNDKLTQSLNDSPISEQWKERILKKLRSIPEVFAFDDVSYGHTTAVKHQIRLHDETPFKERPRPIHPSDREAVKQHLRELLDAGIIRESQSPFASPIVLVRKKNGSIRLCIDYRKLNLRTIRDAYALPNIEETFTALSGAKWFSVMDLKSGYYQVEVADDDKPKTAFVCPLGFYEFNRMPQGVTNAPSTFQRLMERCVGDLHLNEVLVFLDDLIVFSDTLEEHETRLMKVLTRLRDYGLKLSPEKCHFFRSSVKYLGHIVDAHGVHTDPEKISALKTWPRPSTPKELKCFLGFAGYYRRFVEGYSKIAKPLNRLTAGYRPPKKRGKIYKREPPKLADNPNLPLAEQWTHECETAFQTIIGKLTSAPILAFANPQLPYILHTDACRDGLGAALYQEQGGRLRAIAYASRGLSKSEQNYPTHKLEFLALKWAVCEKFSDYLYGSSFTVLTDNNPLTYILTTAKLDAAGHRWLAALSTYHFTIKYRAGQANKDADGLSRRPQEPPHEDEAFVKEKARIDDMKKRLIDMPDELSHETFSALCQRHSVSCPSEPLMIVESLAIDPKSVSEAYGEDILPSMTDADWHTAQRADSSIARVIALVEKSVKPSLKECNAEPSDVKLLLKQWNKLELKNGVLYRKFNDEDSPVYQLVLPKQYHQRAMQGVHDEVGHLGYDRALHLARARFYWPRMAQSIEEKCKQCPRCLRRKALPQKAAPLENIRATFPLELVCIDYLSIEPDNRDTRNVLVLTDHFTKFAVAVPTKDQKAKTIAKALWDNLIIPYGIPSRLLSDQGRDFESKIVKELCALIGTSKIRTTPYHPRGNPVERYNRTLLGMLGTLEDKDKYHWRDFVRPLTHAYNCTKNDTTGYSPFELMFGRQARLPIDLVLGTHPGRNSPKSYSDYIKNLRQNLQESYALAIEHSKKMGVKNKQRFDKTIRAAELFSGDRVLVKNVNIRGKHKLANRWEQNIQVVVKRIKDSPVYVVKPEKGDGPQRTLHRDLLLPCGFLPIEDQSESNSQNGNQRKVRTRSKRNNVKGNDSTNQDEYSDEDEMSDEEGFCIGTWEPYVSTNSPLVRPELLPPKIRPLMDIRSPVIHPDTVIPQVFLPDNDKPTLTPLEVPSTNSPDYAHSGARFSDYAIIDIPESDLTPTVTDIGLAPPEPVASSDNAVNTNAGTTEPAMLRRSERERRPPQKFTYDELGEPLTLAISSFFQTLGVAFSKSVLTPSQYPSWLKMHEETHAV